MLSLEDKLLESWPLCQWQDVTVLVAVSGGADSVALLRAIVSQKTSGEGRILAAHFNHGLRGAASEQDAQFVRMLCQSLNVDLHLGRAELSLTASHHGDSL